MMLSYTSYSGTLSMYCVREITVPCHSHARWMARAVGPHPCRAIQAQQHVRLSSPTAAKLKILKHQNMKAKIKIYYKHSIVQQYFIPCGGHKGLDGYEAAGNSCPCRFISRTGGPPRPCDPVLLHTKDAIIFQRLPRHHTPHSLQNAHAIIADGIPSIAL